MKSLGNYIVERGAAPKVDLVYVIQFEDGTIYNYTDAKDEAQSIVDMLNDEAESNKATIKIMKRSEIIKEQYDEHIDEGMRELKNAVKRVFGIPVPDNTKEVYNDLIKKVDDIAENIQRFDNENGPRCKQALREFIDSVNVIANDLWEQFDDKSEDEKQHILKMWQKAEVVYGLIYEYASKLHDIVDMRYEMNK